MPDLTPSLLAASTPQEVADALRAAALVPGFLDAVEPWLFERFGLAEAVFTPLFMRFWFLDYYEQFELPEEPAFKRVRAWRDAASARLLPG